MPWHGRTDNRRFGTARYQATDCPDGNPSPPRGRSWP